MRQILNTENAPKPIGPYNQAVKIGNLLYTSGQIPIDPATGTKIEGGIREQTRQVLENLKAVLEGAGTTFGKVVKTTVFLADMGHFPEFNAIYAEYFEADTAPARSTIQVAALPLASLVEIELVAHIE